MDTQLFEMHAHTDETSNCGKVPAAEMVEIYKKLGYDGIVVTDHMSTHTFFKYDYSNMTWDEKVDIFLKGYNLAKEAAKDDIKILLGMELRFDLENCENDYLVYGIDENFLRSNGDLINMNIEGFSKLAHSKGLMIFQAHPFRFNMTVTRPKFLDGIEVFNGNPRHNSNNTIASKWAELQGLQMSSGSDFHEHGDEGHGGILFSDKINSNTDLINALRKNDYILKTSKPAM